MLLVFVLFSNMLESLKFEVIRILSTVQIQAPDEVEALERKRRQQAESQQVYFQHAQPTDESGEEGVEEEQYQKTPTIRRTEPKVGRNEPCPCGSGKKYKHCCGKL